MPEFKLTAATMQANFMTPAKGNGPRNLAAPTSALSSERLRSQVQLASIMLLMWSYLAVMSTNGNTTSAPIPMPRWDVPEAPQSQANRAGRKILIVDDNPIILKILGVKLDARGYEVLTAEDGPTAVSTVRREKPDLVLLDLSFPPDVGHGGGVPWDGFLILNWLRRMEEAVNRPIIIITSDDSPATKQRCLAAGVADYFHKPIDREHLLASVERILGALGQRAQ